MKAGKKYITKVGKRNQVTIPAELLRELGLGPGDPVELVSGDGELRVRCSPFQEARIAPLPPHLAGLSNDDIVRLVKEARKERARKVAADDERIVRELRERA